MGSVVSYSNDVKSRVLGVNEDVLVRNGAVSQPVVEAMAPGRNRCVWDGLRYSDIWNCRSGREGLLKACRDGVDCSKHPQWIGVQGVSFPRGPYSGC